MKNFIQSGRRFYGVEMIGFQSEDFGTKLEEVYEVIFNKVKSGWYKTNKVKIENSDEGKEVVDLIFQRFGLTVDLITTKELAAILPFYHNTSHIFLSWKTSDIFDVDNFENLVKKTSLKNGYVDSQRVKVTGVFSIYRNQLYLNFNKMFDKEGLTVREVVSITLRELGHGFYACEYANRVDRCNQILLGLAKEKIADKRGQSSYVYREINDFVGEDLTEEIKSVIAGNVMMGPSLFKLVLGLTKSQMMNAKYDESSFEALADNFATRFGYGRELVSGLQKITTFYGLNPQRFWITFIFFQMRDIKNMVSTITLILALSTMTDALLIAISVYKIITVLFGLLFSGEQTKDYTYDDLLFRYKRVRNGCIEELKQEYITTDRTKTIIETIAEIDKILSGIPNTNWSVNKLIMNFLVPANRRAKDSIETQRILEQLVSNDLFLKAGQLRTIQ